MTTGKKEAARSGTDREADNQGARLRTTVDGGRAYAAEGTGIVFTQMTGC